LYEYYEDYCDETSLEDTVFYTPACKLLLSHSDLSEFQTSMQYFCSLQVYAELVEDRKVIST